MLAAHAARLPVRRARRRRADAFARGPSARCELLTAADGCRGGELGRAVDEPERWVLTVRFASVHAYRRALSPFPVREHVVPLLSEALADEPATFETLLEATAGTSRSHPTLLTDR